jgi:hypothetical protein
MKFSARVSKARAMASQKRKYDLAITAAKEDISKDGIPVLNKIYDTVTKLAPALSVGCNDGKSVSVVTHSFNLIVILTKDALTDQGLLDDIQQSLENEGNILIVHHLASCPDVQEELNKCENQVLKTCLDRVPRFTYLEEAITSVVAAILQPGTVKSDDTKTPPTKRALQGGGGKMATFRLDFKNQYALGIQSDGTGEVYNSKFKESSKKKDLPQDVDASIKELFKLFAGDSESMKWPQFAEVDRIVTECLGGQYSEMISRRAFSMMNYPGLTLEYEITKTTFYNYHYFVAKSMGAMDGDRDANVHYKYIVDKVKTANGSKSLKKNAY